MELALLLIALGFGYKIFVEGSTQTKKNLKQAGRLVGLVMMILAATGAAAKTYDMFRCESLCATENCPMHGMGMMGRHGMFKSFGSKVMCPLSGSSNLSAEKLPPGHPPIEPETK